MLQPFLGEVVGTMILVTLGDGVVANVCLKKTKGQGSGWIVITTAWRAPAAAAPPISGPATGIQL